MLTILIVCIQVYAPEKQLHEALSSEDTVNGSEEEVEEFVMTENPLFEKEKEGLRHRNVEVMQDSAPVKDTLKDEETHEEI
jgi:hypothetical protein